LRAKSSTQSDNLREVGFRARAQLKMPALDFRKTMSSGIERRCSAAISGVSASASPIPSRRMIRTDGETFGMPVLSDRQFQLACFARVHPA
jgi:hypothetical protein